MSQSITSSLRPTYHPLVPPSLVDAAKPYARASVDSFLGSRSDSLERITIEPVFDAIEGLQKYGVLGTAARFAVVATDASIIAAGTLATMLNPFALATRPVETLGNIICAEAWWQSADKAERALAAPAANILANLLGAGLHTAREVLQSKAQRTTDEVEDSSACGKCCSESIGPVEVAYKVDESDDESEAGYIEERYQSQAQCPPAQVAYPQAEIDAEPAVVLPVQEPSASKIG